MSRAETDGGLAADTGLVRRQETDRVQARSTQRGHLRRRGPRRGSSTHGLSATRQASTHGSEVSPSPGQWLRWLRWPCLKVLSASRESSGWAPRGKPTNRLCICARFSPLLPTAFSLSFLTPEFNDPHRSTGPPTDVLLIQSLTSNHPHKDSPFPYFRRSSFATLQAKAAFR